MSISPTATLSGYTLSVLDLDAAVAWYRRSFGAEESGAFELPPYGLKGRSLTTPTGWTIELLQRDASTPRARVDHPLDAALLSGYAGIQVDVDDLDAAFSDLTSTGGTGLMGPHPGPGGFAAYVTDPDGNVIRLRTPGEVPPPPGPPPHAG